MGRCGSNCPELLDEEKGDQDSRSHKKANDLTTIPSEEGASKRHGHYACSTSSTYDDCTHEVDGLDKSSDPGITLRI